METDNSRENILETAVKLFSSGGYDGVSVQEICDASGITKPTLYYFFKSKQGLLEAVRDTRGTEFLQVVRQSAVYEGDFTNSLTKMLVAQIEFAKKHREFYRLHIGLVNAPVDSEAKIIWEPLDKKISAVVDEFFVLSANEFGNMRSKEKLYSLLFRNTVSSVTNMVLSKKLKLTDELIYQIIHSFVYGVAS